MLLKLTSLKQIKHHLINTLLLIISSLVFIGCNGAPPPEPTLPDKVAFEAWVGKDDSLVTIKTPLPDNAELYSFRNKDCDISNITACEQGQNLVLNNQTITDPAFTLGKPAYYQLKNGTLKSQASPASADKFSGRNVHQAVEFNNKLWLIGGHDSEPGNIAKNDIWSSDDGITWIQETASAAFSARSGHQVTVFNNKLWLIGGYSSDLKNDVWSSSDGINWTEETASAAFSARTGHQATVFNNKLWIIGGYEFNSGRRIFKNDIWSSSDGKTWIQESASTAFSARAHHQVTVFNNKLWIIGGGNNSSLSEGNNSGLKNDIWSSSDGKNWTQESASAAFSARWRYQVAVFNNKLWLIGGYDGNRSKRIQNDVWSSSDGINWTQESASAVFSARSGHQVAVFNNKLWLIGGHDGSSYKNDVWSSNDGKNWTQETSSAAFSVRWHHQVAVFNNKLWLIGGRNYNGYKNDIWSSDNSINWIQESASAAFSARSDHQVAVFNNKLWVIGGYGFNSGRLSYKNDIWSSEDGINWTQESASAAFSARYGHKVTVFNNKLWLIGGYDGNSSKIMQNDVWSSSDGINWTQESASAAFSARSDHQVAVFNNKLWLIGGYDGSYRFKNDIWSSEDGKNWTQESASAAFSARAEHQVAVFNNKLWLIGGWNYSGYKNDAWSSSDGKSWTQETANAAFSVRNGHQVVVSNNQLWLIGGVDGSNQTDVWKSTDGKNWRKGYSGTIYK